MCLEFEAEVSVQKRLLANYDGQRLANRPSMILQDSLTDLERSAQSGCASCKLFHNYLVRACLTTSDFAQFRQSSSPVQVQPFEKIAQSDRRLVSVVTCNDAEACITFGDLTRKSCSEGSRE